MFIRNKNIKLLFKFFLVPFLAGWLFYSLYRQILNQPHLHESWELIKAVPTARDAWKFWLAVILVFFNWGTESMKWRLLLKPLETITFSRAFKSVLSGVTLSVNTPNRIGEYGGRLLYVSEGNRLKSIPLSIAGSISQLIITLFSGSIALCYTLFFVLPPNDGLSVISRKWLIILTIVSAVTTIVLSALFIKISWLIRFIQRIPGGKKLAPYIDTVGQFPIKILLSLILLSLFRYIIFILQYQLLLQALNVGIGWTPGMLMTALLFLLLAIIPSFAIADLGIRGALSVALFGIYSTNLLGIAGAAFGIWVLNLFIPALAGSIMILSIKFFKEKKI